MYTVWINDKAEHVLLGSAYAKLKGDYVNSGVFDDLRCAIIDAKSTAEELEYKCFLDLMIVDFRWALTVVESSRDDML